jgi:tetratricopeptide (TPR) repeat protein
MGNICRKKEDFSTAIEHVKKALKICTELNKINPEEYSPKMADILLLLGDYHTLIKKYSVSIVEYEEALRIYCELAGKDIDSSKHQLDVSKVLHCLGDVYVLKDECEEGIAYYKDALDIARSDNIVENLYTIAELQAKILESMINTYITIENYEEAICTIKEILPICRLKLALNPAREIPKLAEIRTIQGELYSHLEQPENSLLEIIEARKLYEFLTAYFPETYFDKFKSITNICILTYQEVGKYKEANELAEDVLALYRYLATKEPEEFLPIVVIYLGHIAGYHNTFTQEREKALKLAHEIIQITSSMEEKDEEIISVIQLAESIIER